MAFDGFTPQEHVQSTPSAPVERAPLFDAQRREAMAEAQLKGAEKALTDFYELALSGQRLDQNQKILLGRLSTDNSLNRLTQVEYTDPTTGAESTFSDYFVGSEDVLVAAKRLILERERASDAHVASVKAVEAIRNAPRETGPQRLKPLPGSGSFEERLRQALADADAERKAHFDGMQKAYALPIVMPTPRPRPKVVEMNIPGDAFASPKLEDATLTPEALGIVPPPPVAEAQPVVMPEIHSATPPPAPKQSWFGRMAA